MKILSVVGARPQFVKLAPISAAARQRSHEHVVVHTGQHYDHDMSDVFFSELGISAPDYNLQAGSDSPGMQLSKMVAALEPVVLRERPDFVLAYGDTNSTLAAAVTVPKVGVKLAHLEAGLRSFNRAMPEETNRVLTDHASDLLLAPTSLALAHLQAEGLGDRSTLVGDVMCDVLYATRERIRATPVVSSISPDIRNFVLATIHRPSNTDDPERLGRVISALSRIPLPVYLAAHPRLVAAGGRSGIELEAGSIRVIDPLSYPQLVQALESAAAVVTDSGGLQKEAYMMGVLTTTLRAETEWVETLEAGWNVLAPDLKGLSEVVLRDSPASEPAPHYGDGRSSLRVIDALEALLDGVS